MSTPASRKRSPSVASETPSGDLIPQDYTKDERESSQDDSSPEEDQDGGTRSSVEVSPEHDWEDNEDEEAPPAKKKPRLTPQYTRLLATNVLTLPEYHDRGISEVKISPDGTKLASCSADSTISIISLPSGKPLANLTGHLAGVNTITWSPDSRILASGSDDKSIRIWDTETAKPASSPLMGHHNYVSAICISPKGNILASGSYDEALFIWDVRLGRLLRSLPAHSDPVTCVDFVRDATLVVSCSSDGLVRVWDTVTGQCLRTIVHEPDNPAVARVRFAPNGNFLLSVTLDNALRLWNYVEGRCVKTFLGHTNTKYGVGAGFATITCAEDKADGDASSLAGSEYSTPTKWACVVAGSENGSIFAWDVNSKSILMEVERAHKGPVLALDVRDNFVVTASLDGVIKIWTLAPDPESEVR